VKKPGAEEACDAIGYGNATGAEGMLFLTTSTGLVPESGSPSDLKRRGRRGADIGSVNGDNFAWRKRSRCPAGGVDDAGRSEGGSGLPQARIEHEASG
jgi:hypothetical protein